ncbi:hypothetical protein DFH09DRAFT_1067155 [Mycena vulgaris]|nr:hypothetical protein DFH09DRAFT_1067155 [Mycena vulgaris]
MALSSTVFPRPLPSIALGWVASLVPRVSVFTTFVQSLLPQTSPSPHLPHLQHVRETSRVLQHVPTPARTPSPPPQSSFNRPSMSDEALFFVLDLHPYNITFAPGPPPATPSLYPLPYILLTRLFAATSSHLSLTSPFFIPAFPLVPAILHPCLPLGSRYSSSLPSPWFPLFFILPCFVAHLPTVRHLPPIVTPLLTQWIPDASSLLPFTSMPHPTLHLLLTW